MKSMQIQIKDGTYKNIPAVILTNGALKITILAGHGGKIASLTDLRSGREFLLQTPNALYKPQQYDGDYTSEECSGFDDMFPTVDPIPYPDFPWKGTVMPDHGEVCALSWKHEILKNALKLSVDGVRFPYSFSKTIAFFDENRTLAPYEKRQWTLEMEIVSK